MVHRWDELTFLHWRYPAKAAQRLLPPGLRVEEREGSAWVGLVPFYLRVALPHTRPLPWASQFAETNVRTYVRTPSGDHSHDASRHATSTAGRAGLCQLPWSGA